jgi:hypothetical protein
MAFLSISITAYAADFFPLDVWEDLEVWEQNSGEVYATAAEAYSEPMSRGLGKVEKFSFLSLQ